MPASGSDEKKHGPEEKTHHYLALSNSEVDELAREFKQCSCDKSNGPRVITCTSCITHRPLAFTAFAIQNNIPRGYGSRAEVSQMRDEVKKARISQTTKEIKRGNGIFVNGKKWNADIGGEVESFVCAELKIDDAKYNDIANSLDQLCNDVEMLTAFSRALFSPPSLDEAPFLPVAFNMSKHTPNLIRDARTNEVYFDITTHITLSLILTLDPPMHGLYQREVSLPGTVVTHSQFVQGQGFVYLPGYPQFSNSLLKLMATAKPGTLRLTDELIQLAQVEEELRKKEVLSDKDKVMLTALGEMIAYCSQKENKQITPQAIQRILSATKNLIDNMNAYEKDPSDASAFGQSLRNYAALRNEVHVRGLDILSAIMKTIFGLGLVVLGICSLVMTSALPVSSAAVIFSGIALFSNGPSFKELWERNKLDKIMDAVEENIRKPEIKRGN